MTSKRSLDLAREWLRTEISDYPTFIMEKGESLAALLDTVRQEQHEATIMDLWPRLQQSIRTVSMQRIVHPGPPDPQPQGSEANR